MESQRGDRGRPQPSSTADSFTIKAPTISLPKGGGAIRGMGEKFTANPVLGTGSFAIPLGASQGRGGFGPTLELTYNSGSSNGPFGFGWTLGLPTITRKTDKGLPQYGDDDVFVLSSAEDLVPELDASGAYVETVRDGYRVRRYRPRIEGLFARIERWSKPGDTHWRSISRDNTTTIYGKTDDSRIVDPADATRVFSWLLCESYDGKGNVITYSYDAEDARGVDRSLPHERNRSNARGTQRYLRRILYGNRQPQLSPSAPSPSSWLFEIVFDYDEGFVQPLSATSWEVTPVASKPWAVRPDPFSSYRSTFEVRSYRRCNRVLMFHRFPELGADPQLVRSTELVYEDLSYANAPAIDAELAHLGSTRTGSFLRSVSQHGHLLDTTQPAFDRGGVRVLTYVTRSLPPVELEYSRATIDPAVRELTGESLDNLPAGIDEGSYRWIDLDGEGLSGVLTEQGGAWFYKRNDAEIGERLADTRPRLGPVERLATLPVPASLAAGQQLLDVTGDGRLELVRFGGTTPGYFERTANGWETFRAFASLPNVAFDARSRRLLDLTGDGLADLLETSPDEFTWYPSLAERGFGAAERVAIPADEEAGPHLVFADGTQSIYVADMSGDGLSDLVRVRNGEVCYWPHLGYGRFGAKVTMDRSPWLDEPDQFDQRRVRLVDLDGSGTTDLVYLGADHVCLYFNQSGNGFSAAKQLSPSPRFDNASSVFTADLLGNGTACLVWSSALPPDQPRPIHYIDLMGGTKPHLLIGIENNLGLQTRITYAPSTKFYLADRRAGKPWVTRLPFPVYCVAKVELTDRWQGATFSTSYTYHHGFYDGTERELRGFGRVEQVDVQRNGTFAAGNIASPYITQDRTLYQPPVKTVTWYDTGAFVEREQIEAELESEYVHPAAPGGFREHRLPAPALPATTDPDERREALRACKGRFVRQEVYELDVDALERDGTHRAVRLYTTSFRSHEIQQLQARGRNQHAVFLPTDLESITYNYDLDLRSGADPDPRVSHTLNLDTDGFGNVRQAINVTYARNGSHVDPAPLPPGAAATIARVQGELHVAYTEQRFTNNVDDNTGRRTPATCETLTYELTGIQPSSGYFTLHELRALALSDVYAPRAAPVVSVGTRAYHLPGGTGPQRRLVEHARTLYFNAALTGPRPLGQIDARGVKFEDYKLALTDPLLDAVFGSLMTPAIRTIVGTPARSGYLSGPLLAARFGAAAAGEYWMRSGISRVDPQRFYLPVEHTDAFDNPTKVTYVHDLLVASVTDALTSTTTITAFDFRVLAASRIEDKNGNVAEVAFDALGLPAAFAHVPGGDTVTGVDISPGLQRVDAFFTGTYSESEARLLLGNASGRHLYYLGERIEPDGTLSWGHHPASAASIQRERHRTDLATGARLQTAFEYSDGSGGVLVKKTKAEPAEGTATLRWLASGKTVLNNKKKAVKQYEPYFSSNEHRYEEVAEVGETPVMYYDAIGRLIRTESPDGSYSRVEASPWHVTRYDANDTVGESGNAWYAAHSAATAPAEQRRAAASTLVHANTPTRTFLDSLGREVISIVEERHQYPGEAAPSAPQRFVTFTKLDTEGKPLWIRDARKNLVMQYIQPPMPNSASVDVTTGYSPCYDIAGNQLFQHSMDSGSAWSLNDASGKPMFAWTSNERAGVIENRILDARYDKLHRPTDTWLTTNGGAPQLIERRTYGEGVANDRARGLRGQLYEHFDASGLATVMRYDYAARPLETFRRLASQYTAARIDWQTATLEQETFIQLTDYDALGRPRRLYSPHRANARVAVYEPRYNERGLLDREELVIRATKTAAGYTEGATSQRATVIDSITYDAKGQRTLIRYANGTRTRFTYDPKTFRLTQLRTTRPNYDPAFPSAVAQFRNANVVQNLFYTHDAVGNVTEVYDDAFRPAFFANQQIDPIARYTYDSLYRLLAASGREHTALATPGQYEAAPFSTTFPVPQADPADQRNYAERFEYDAVGNVLQLVHTTTNGWTRNFKYEDYTNRLQRTWFGTGTQNATTYAHDSHGNMLVFASTAPADRFEWDHRDMIRVLERGGGGRVYYQYDADKQRTRKVSETQNGVKAWERIYLGGFEIYRRYGSGGVVEEIETHHVFEGDRRVLVVDDVITTNRPGATPGPLYRYQYSNQLGSACLELDANAAVISYEEYHPYGSSAYRMARSQAEAPKRYRFTGKERDEESGLSYHSARYHAPWLCRWVSPDPAGLADGVSRYLYCRSNPTSRTDADGKQSQPAEDRAKKPERGFIDRLFYGANPAAGGHPLIENAIWNEWMTGRAPRAVRVRLNSWRGFIMDNLTGNNLGRNRALVDRRVGNIIEQTKSFWSKRADAATKLRDIAVAATRDAAEWVRRQPRAERLTRLFPRARIVLPSWASASLEQAAQTALNTAGRARSVVRSLPRFALSPVVTRGIPGLLGMTARAAQRVAVPLLAVGLVNAIRRGDGLGVADNTIGLVPIGLQALSKASFAAPVASIAARASAVTAAFSVGWTIGRAIDEHVLSEETRTAIGGTINEIVNNEGWREIYRHPFGIGL